MPDPIRDDPDSPDFDPQPRPCPADPTVHPDPDVPPEPPDGIAPEPPDKPHGGHHGHGHDKGGKK